MEFDKLELIAVLSGLVGTVGVLWRMHVTQTKQESERLKRCEDMHAQAQQTVVQLTADYHELKGRMNGVEALSHSVLRELKNNAEGKSSD